MPFSHYLAVGFLSNSLDFYLTPSLSLTLLAQPTVMYLASGTPVWNVNDCTNISSVRATPLTAEVRALLLNLDLINQFVG